MKHTKQVPKKTSHWLLALAITCPFALSGVYGQDEDLEEEEVFELSPFEVTSSEDDIGYRQQNTLAGSRMNTNIGDIAASISVITKEQMEDTASTDLNDIFRYEASTEGSSTYTPGVSSMRGDGVADVNAGYASGANGVAQTNATANTVRGLGSPSAAINFYRAINQIPLDSYNVQSVEISRGPNSMLFGTGSPAGVVNQSRSSAVLNETGYSVKLRFDDRGSKRASLTFNAPLIEDKLAFFGAYLTDDKEFTRKPSYDDTERFYGAITYTPFEKTKLTFNFENYENENSRPNTLTPVDYVSTWMESGMPMYDSVNHTVTYAATGETAGIYIRNTASPLIDDVRSYISSLDGYDASLWNEAQTTYNGVSIVGSSAMTNPDSVLYVSGMGYAASRPTMQVADGSIANWVEGLTGRYYQQYGSETDPSSYPAIYPTTTEIYANTANANAYEQFWTTSYDNSAANGNIANWKYAGVTDQSIYDWENINILSMNFGEEEAQTYNLEFEQQLSDDLYFSAGWFRQEFESYSSYTVSQLNATALYVDTNLYLPDGSENPYAGSVYVQDMDPDRFRTQITNDQLRAILAFTPDFTTNDNWTRWLGKHQFLAFASEEEELRDYWRMRLSWTASDEEDAGMIRYLSNYYDDADGNATGFSYVNRGRTTRRAYYLTDSGLTVDEYGLATTASGGLSADSYTDTMMVYNYDTESWEEVSYTASYEAFAATTGSSKTKISSWNIGGTSHFWEDRIVATYGIRNDKVSNTSTTTGAIYDDDGNLVEAALESTDIYVDGYLNEDLVMNRYRGWTTVEEKTSTFGVVFRPFKGWENVESSAKKGNLFAEFVNTLGFTYNNSETFNPPTSDYVDLFGNELPKPSGKGEDWGVQFSLFNNKLFARISQYESSNENQTISGGTAYSRFTSNLDTSTFRNWARTIALINWGQDPTDSETFGQNLTTAQQDQLEADIEAIWGLPYDYYSDLGSTGATRSVYAEGTELEISYNPKPNWTIKLTGSKQETVYDNVLKEYTEWFNYRFPDWENAQAADYLLADYANFITYTTDTGREVDLTNFMSSYGYVSQVTLDNVYGNTSVEAYYNNILVPQVRLQQDLEGQVITNQSKYQASLLTNYKFTGDRLKGVSVGGSLRWLDKKSIGYYGMASGNGGDDYLDLSDVTRPIYTPAQTYYDFWAAYRTTIMNESVDMKIQLNVVNAFESGGLQVVGVNLDGTPYAYRIIDPRTFQLSLSFDM
ncbi:TonB-dependent receptor plug domain-containing protein [Pelagicoccus albus]|uniref:TonB-dependent receptor plug domain-containing protein n=1 Tax=Pelagicoccus albus TaxID=415222 RepID=A0A7X1B8V1_9BACT|nr:TonB-dependent receptor plug domain-containing protein [Pelagicoccus albus]MBC2606495.1 TonB-dependent receptor plug domain-containing protein [Pelagicoccus albus]